MIQRVRPHIGTLVAIETDASTERKALAAIEDAFAAIERVHALLHPQTGTDSRRVRDAACGERVRIDAWSYEILSICAELQAASGGVFDPCRPERPGRMRDIDLTVAGSATKLAEVELDLGGIAKGFAVDRAVGALREHGCGSGIVNAGGDLRVFGPAREVMLRLATGTAYPLELEEAAVAVSEPKSDRSPREHVGYYVGATGEPVTGRWVAVTAPTATLADGLAKCAMLCSADVAQHLLRRYGARAVLGPASRQGG
jgi:thiamine biosynthesis lipoprotein